MAKHETPGAALRGWITRSERTQTDVAEELGCRISTLNDILSGRRRPSLDLAVRIERVTGIPARSFAQVA